jgi:hypothetical protein
VDCLPSAPGDAPGGLSLRHISIADGSYRAVAPPGCKVVSAVVYNPTLAGDEVMAQIHSVIDGVAHASTWLQEHSRIEYLIIPGCSDR